MCSKMSKSENGGKRSFEDVIEEIIREEPRYKPEAYIFLLEALGWIIDHLEEKRHITGQELLEGIRKYALESFGPTARMVFEHWGVTTTEDFGVVVFQLVSRNILATTETDSISDFVDVYDFKTAFEDNYSWAVEQKSERNGRQS